MLLQFEGVVQFVQKKNAITKKECFGNYEVNSNFNEDDLIHNQNKEWMFWKLRG